MSSSSYQPRDLRPSVRRARGRTIDATGKRIKRGSQTKDIGALQTRFALLTYALSRLPPRQLPLLAIYASSIVYAAEKGWIPTASVGKAGASIVGVLSMVTGLLLSHRFSSAVSKWEEGKKVWVGVRTNIRDATRMISIVTPPPDTGSPAGSDPPSLLGISSSASEASSPGKSSKGISGSPRTRAGTSGDEAGRKRRDVAMDRVDELAGLFVGFAFALQHHLHNTRPLPQPPLCDLLPPGYLASLKRTEARVRFAEDHMSSASGKADLPNPASDTSISDILRPGMRRRLTGPPTSEERSSAGDGQEEWELSNLREKAEDAVSQLAEAVAGLGGVEDKELRRQLNELSEFAVGDESDDDDDGKKGRTGAEKFESGVSGESGSTRTKSNLANPTPPNLPLAVLKLLEAYVVGLAEVPSARGGWSEAKRDRALGIVKSLSETLGNAERLSSTPPPLPLTLHSYHLLTIYLAAIPPSLLCAISGPALVIVTLIAGWCLLGLEALVGEVGGVFGGHESHHPIPVYTNRILVESLDMCPGLAGAYRARLVARVGEDDGEVVALDRRRKGREEWTPSFA